MTINFGKHAGTDIHDVPQDYLEWLHKANADLNAAIEREFERRQLLEEAEMPMMERLVQSGYRALAKSYHPDAGGATKDFQALQAAYEQLKIVLKEVKQLV